MKKLYNFDFGSRYSQIAGLFVEEDSVVESYISKAVWLGEVDGKHSDVEGTLDSSDLTIVTEDPELIAAFEKMLPNGFGINPIAEIQEQEQRAML